MYYFLTDLESDVRTVDLSSLADNLQTISSTIYVKAESLNNTFANENQ